MAKTYDIDAGTIRRVDWLELIPMTLFFRAFSATFKPTFLLLLAALTVLPLVWTKDVENAQSSAGIVNLNPTDDSLGSLRYVSDRAFFESLSNGTAPVRDLWRFATWNPSNRARNFAETNSSNKATLALYLATFVVGLWLALAISRTAVVRLTTTSRSSTFASMRFALKRLPAALLTCVAPLCVLLALFVVWYVARWAVWVGLFLAPFVGAFFVLTEFILILLIVAVPLGLSAIAAENCDGFDAISRSVSYLIQRTLIWLLYIAVAQLLIIVGTFIVYSVSYLACECYVTCFDVAANSWSSFWGRLIAQIPVAYPYAAAVVYCNAIYIMLRRSVDGTPFDSCALNLKGTAPRKLRKILKDGKGAPIFDAQNAASQRATSSTTSASSAASASEKAAEQEGDS